MASRYWCGGLNLLTANQASAETDTTGWVATNAAMASSAAQALDGTKSLAATASSAAAVEVGAGALNAAPISVTAGVTYTLVGSSRAATATRSVFARIYWYTALNGSFISASSGTPVTNSTSAWTQHVVTGAAPATATVAVLRIYVTAPANAEVHYVDCLGFWVGSGTTWALPTGNTTSNWSDTANWATTDGGTPGAAAPTAADDVYLTATTGGVPVVANGAAAVCRSLTCTGYTGTLFVNAATSLNIGDNSGGAITLVAGMTVTLGAGSQTAFIATSDNGGAGWPLTFGGKSLGLVRFNATGGKWQLQDAMTATSTVFLTYGTLDTNGQTCSWAAFDSNNANTRTLTLGSSAITITGGNNAWLTTGTLTVTTNTAVITMSNVSGGFNAGGGGGGSVHGASLVWSGSTGGNIANPVTDVTNITINGTAIKVNSFNIYGNVTLTGTFTATGQSATNRLLVQSSAVGTPRTISAGSISLTNVDFMDITGAGLAANAAWTGTSLGDCQGNSNITCDTPAPQTWRGGAWLTGSCPGATVDSYNGSASAVLSISTGGGQAGGQTFTGNGGMLGTAKWKLNQVNASASPSLVLAAKVYAHSGTWGNSGVPTGAALATSDGVNATTLSASYDWVTFSFSGANQVVLTNGTHYVVTLEISSGSPDPTTTINLGVESFNAHAGNHCYIWPYGSTTWVAYAPYDTPFFVNEVNGSYLRTTGVASSYASTPDSVPLSITGDIDIRVRVALDDWTPATTQNLVVKWASSQLSYNLSVGTDGKVRSAWTADHATVLGLTSSVATGLTDGSVKWVRATVDVDNGAGGSDQKYYLSDDGISWAQLGTTRTNAGTTSIYDGTALLEVGSQFGGTQNNTVGNFYRAQVRNNILDDGTGIVFDADFTAPAADAVSFTESSANAATVSINQVGGSWSDVTKWTSRVPLPQDDVTIKSSVPSGQTVTLDMPQMCKSLTLTGFAGAFSRSIVNSIYGNLTLGASMTYSGSTTQVFQFRGRGAQTLTTNGNGFGSGDIYLYAPGGTYTQQDNCILSTKSVVVVSGTWNANNFNWSGWLFQVQTNTTVYMGSGTWTLTASTGTVWSAVSTSPVYCGTSTIVITSTGSTPKTFIGGGLVYNNLVITGGTKSGVIITGANTFASLTVGAGMLTLPSATTTSVGDFVCSGTLGNANSLVASTPGSAATLAVTGPNLLTANQASIETETTGLVARTHTTIARSTLKSLHGVASLAVTTTASGACDVDTSPVLAPVSANLSYTAQASFYTNIAARTGRVLIGWYNGSTFSYSSNSGSLTQNAWTPVSVTATAPADAVSAIVVVQCTNAAGADELYYVDKLGLWQGTSTAWRSPNNHKNLLTANQASFDTDIADYSTVNTASTLARSTTQSFQGAASLQLTATGNQAYSAAQGLVPVNTKAIPAVAGSQYTVSCAVKSATVPRQFRAQISWYTASAAWISVSSGAYVTSTTSGWTVATCTDVPPATAALVTVQIFVNSVAAGEVHYVDCLGLWEGARTDWLMPGTTDNGVTPASYLTVKDITATGGASFKAINSQNVSGNTGWTFANQRNQQSSRTPANGLTLPGVAGNYASTPDSAPLSITGDIDIRVQVALRDWTPPAINALVGKYTGSNNQRSYLLNITTGGSANLFLSANGTAASQVTSSAVVGAADGAVKWVRATWRASDGRVQFFLSDDGLSWAQLGTNQTIAYAAIYDSSQALEVGSWASGGSYLAAGTFYRAEVRNGINGTVVASPDFTGTQSSGFHDAQGNVWTVNPASGMLLSGVAGNYASTPDSAPLSITGDIDLRVRCALADWTPAVDTSFLAKYVTTGNQRSYYFWVHTDGKLNLTRWTDGTGATGIVLTSSAATSITDGATKWVRVTLNAATGGGKFYTSDDGSSWSQLGTDVSAASGGAYDGTASLEIGACQTGAVNPATGTFYYAEVRNGIDGTVVASPNFTSVPASGFSDAQGNVWTIGGNLPARLKQRTVATTRSAASGRVLT